MRKRLLPSLAFALAALAVFTASGAVQAQAVTQVQGTIQEVDCATNTLTLQAADGAHRFAASSATAVYLGSTGSTLCALSHYVGSRATVWATSSGDQAVAGRVDVAPVAAAPAPAPPVAPAPAPSNGGAQYSSPPTNSCSPLYAPYYGGAYSYGPYFGPCYFPFGVGIYGPSPQ